MKLLILVLALLLAGCASAEKERKARAEAERQAQYHAKCLEYGFEVGTVAYGTCRQNFDTMAAQERAMKKSIMLQHLLGR